MSLRVFKINIEHWEGLSQALGKGFVKVRVLWNCQSLKLLLKLSLKLSVKLPFEIEASAVWIGFRSVPSFQRDFSSHVSVLPFIQMVHFKQ